MAFNLKNKLHQLEYDSTLKKGLLLLSFVLCVVFLLLQAKAQAYNLVFSDHIDLFMRYFQNEDMASLFFQQHGPHRQGLGAIIMLPILDFANWDIRSLSYLTVFIMALSAVLLMMVMRHKSIQLLPSIAIVTLILSLGSIELITITPNISHTALPILFSCLLLWLMLRFRLKGFWPNAIVIIIVMLSLFTGFGIFLFCSYLLVFTLYLISDMWHENKLNNDKLVLAFFTYVALILSLVIFFTNYTFSSAEGCAQTALSNIPSVINFSFAIASMPFGGSSLGMLSVPIGFSVMAMFTIISFLALRNIFICRSIDNFAILVLVVASGTFVINAAIGRHCLGIDSAYASRYYQFVSLGVIGTLFALSMWCRERWSIAVKVLSLIIIGVTLFSVNPAMKRLGDGFSAHKNNFAVCVKQGGSVYDCNLKFIIYPPDGNRLDSLLLMIKNSSV